MSWRGCGPEWNAVLVALASIAVALCFTLAGLWLGAVLTIAAGVGLYLAVRL